MSGVVIAKSQEDLQVQEATSNKSHFNHLNHKECKCKKATSNKYIICPEPEHILASKIIIFQTLAPGFFSCSRNMAHLYGALEKALSLV